jgi:hypothetical protein
VRLFYAQGGNLSRIGTDMQLLTGNYAVAREWFLRLANHPVQISGFVYPSRHDRSRKNIALIRRSILLAEFEPTLIGPAADHPKHLAKLRGKLLYGPALRLADHVELEDSLKELQVARLP